MHAARAARLFFTIRPIKFLSYCSVSLQLSSWILGSLGNHDDDGNKNPTNLHILQWKTVFLHALHVHFSFLTFCRRSRSFYDVKWPVSQLCGRRERMMTNIQFCLLLSKRWFQLNSRMVRTRFSSIMTLNNWKIIAEMRSYIFRLRSRFRRRRVYLSSLLKPKPAAVNLLFSVLAWLQFVPKDLAHFIQRDQHQIIVKYYLTIIHWGGGE